MNLGAWVDPSEGVPQERLDGGQGQSVRVGHLVLKPVDNHEKYEWMAQVLEHLAFDVDVARPVRSKRGHWIEDGYGATLYFEGGFERHRLAEKLRAAQAFHLATQGVVRPREWNRWASPWSQAARVAWRESPLPSGLPPMVVHRLEGLFSRYAPLELPQHFVHSDLAGNLLFGQDGPFVIDVSPDFRPAAYAAAVLVADSVAWYGEPVASLSLLEGPDDQRAQLLLRAVAFRVCVPLFLVPGNSAAFDATWAQFAPVLGALR